MKLPGFMAEHSIHTSSYTYDKNLTRFDQTYKVIPAVPKGGGGSTGSSCSSDLKDDQDACDKQYDLDLASKDPHAESNWDTCIIEAESKYNRCRRGAGSGTGTVIA